MKRMLIDAAHSEETRVVLLDGTRIDDFESETSGKQQHKGNIYVGEVSRVEPSLQAAFITYGGNRNGFLAFGELHPEFFHLPKAEKARLMEELAEQAARRRSDDDADDTATSTEGSSERSAERAPRSTEPRGRHGGRARPKRLGESQSDAPADDNAANNSDAETELGNQAPVPQPSVYEDDEDAAAAAKAAALADAAERGVEGNKEEKSGGKRRSRPAKGKAPEADKGGANGPRNRKPKRLNARNGGEGKQASATAEGADDREESKSERPRGPVHRRYRIQDVLKEGQKVLVQVVKEERGSKGAALTTYISLPGRYTVLMPNTPNAGGISRKITDYDERRQLRDMYRALDVPATMGVIIRTAGMGQDVEHIKTDYTNLQQLWSHITQEFEAEGGVRCLHEDGSIIVRALRDMAGDDVEEIVISGARAYKAAKDFAKAFMPETLKKISLYKEEAPIFSHYKVEGKLLQLHHQRVQLPSGGSIVINPTEALVSIDINSGRNTHERNIEETAYKTNLEACEEIARQVRLRDLAGLIVVDFIDMESYGNTRKVEQAMRRALKRDRARIQTANISEFGLMEISRQRLRPSFGESHFMTCPHCNGSGLVTSPSTSGLMLLRRLEEEDAQGADRVTAVAATATVMWVLNHKRELIRSLEEKYKYQLLFRADDSLIAPDAKLELSTMKADGTELTSQVAVDLREQPEVPPEKRYTKEGRAQRQREEEAREELKRGDRAERGNRSGQERPERKETDRAPRRESSGKTEAASAKAEQPATSGEAQGTEAPAKGEGRRRGGRPARVEGSTEGSAPAHGEAATKPAAPRPARTPVAVADTPLAVAKVEADTSSVPLPAAPAKPKVALKVQPDTDRDLTPIAVAKVSTDGTVQEEKKPARSSKKPASGGILNRLLGM